MIEINVGIALSDMHLADLPAGLRVPEDLATYAREYRAAMGIEEVFFELQPEDRFARPARYPDQFQHRLANRWMRALRTGREFRHFLLHERPRIGVHMPTVAKDPLSSNFFGKHTALEEIKRAMDFAHQIGADYFVVHLATRDKWTWERSDQIAKGLKIFKEIAVHYSVKGYQFTPVIEVLPYPRFPAHGGELSYIFNQAHHILSKVRIAFNISHLWQSWRRMSAIGLWDPEVSFIQHLDYSLSQVWDKVHVFQLGGCWESETHAIPGLHPQQNPFEHLLKLRESPGVYAESGEIDLNNVLRLLVEYTVARGRPLNLVLDIRDRDIMQVLEATCHIRKDLLDRAGIQPAN